MSSNNNLGKFIEKQLNLSLLKRDIIEKIISYEKEWRSCFTHKSVHPYENYESYEFTGDKIVNMLAAQYVERTHQDINTPVWRTKIHHKIVSSKILGQIGREVGFEEFLNVGDDFLVELKERSNLLPGQDIKNHKKYISIIEDIVEAFFGCLSYIIQTKLGKSLGVSIEICKRIIFSYYRSIDIDISYESIFDPATRIKELYQSKMRWYEHVDVDDPKKEKRKTKYFIDKSEVGKDGITRYTTIVYAWPLGDRNVKCTYCSGGNRKDPNRQQVAMEVGTDEEETRMRAFSSALKYLEKLNIKLPHPPKKM